MAIKEIPTNFRVYYTAMRKAIRPKYEEGVEQYESLLKEEKALYDEVIKSIHLQYLQKIFTEFFRTILLVIKDRGYENTIDFTYKYFFQHVQSKFNAETKRANPVSLKALTYGLIIGTTFVLAHSLNISRAFS